MYHFPQGFLEARHQDLDTPQASIKVRTVREDFKNREAYIVPAYYVFIPLKGQKVFYLTGSEVSVDPGQVLLIRKGACLTCDVTRLDQGVFEAVMFLMDEKFIAEVLKKYALATPAPGQEAALCRLETTPFFQACVESLMPYFMQTAPAREHLIRLKMEELLLNLLEGPQLAEVLSVIGDAAIQDREPYLEHVESWIQDAQTIEQMAAAVHQSPTAFKNNFKRLFGLPPAQYLQERRLERAYQQVLTSPDSMTQIALANGFESPSHFTQVFRRRFGLTPGQLKKAKLDPRLSA